MIRTRLGIFQAMNLIWDFDLSGATYVVLPTGFEPVTVGLEDRCSIR